MVLFRLILVLSMYEEIGEFIEVVVVFRNGKAFPHSFKWKDRKYLVKQINLEHQEARGNSRMFCFSVSAYGNSYELSFDNINLIWKLERIWEE